MSIEINEVVKSYVFNAHGNIVNARITRGGDGYSWDVSHFRIAERSKTVMPISEPAVTFDEAFDQLKAYVNEYVPGHSPYKNVNY
ncbi:hypothetical protein [Pseudomonas fluorescens]|uniref:hypothetical protein n=1 Tax=Pseudomonas fluorescens TaxID=294 RepID=UPI0028604F54|nr:hypothetical protein [Pseudomonas fluorescens]MDR6162373.1 hypothetical protein [Pseudomonas fluorescens]